MAVDEYWVVDLEGRHVERWFKDRPNVEFVRDRLVWQLRGAPEPVTIDLRELFSA